MGCGCRRVTGHLVQSCKVCDHLTRRKVPGKRGIIFHGDGPVWGCKKGRTRFLNFRDDDSQRWVPRLCDDFVFTIEGQLSVWASFVAWLRRIFH